MDRLTAAAWAPDGKSLRRRGGTEYTADRNSMSDPPPLFEQPPVWDGDKPLTNCQPHEILIWAPCATPSSEAKGFEVKCRPAGSGRLWHWNLFNCVVWAGRMSLGSTCIVSLKQSNTTMQWNKTMGLLLIWKVADIFPDKKQFITNTADRSCLQPSVSIKSKSSAVSPFLNM